MTSGFNQAIAMDNCELLCPLCCGEKFSGRAALKDHLAKVAHGVTCPVCLVTQSSISDLLIHLESETCDISRLETTVDDQSCITDNLQKNTAYEDESNVKDNKTVQMESASQELKFVSSDGGQTLNVVSDSESHILIVSESDILSNRGIITTQNEDGTISFTQVGTEELSDGETGAHLLDGRAEDEASGTEEELYSCNTCGVSFTSVVDHIHNYHSEQDVVVEVAESETELVNPEEVKNEVLESKRVITAAGKIITEQQYDHLVIRKDADGNLNVKEMDNADDKSGISYTQRLVKINKFWENSHLTVESAEDGSESLQFENGQDLTKVYGCSKCHVKSTSIQVLETHVCRSNVERQTGMYNCVHCSCSFNNSKSLCAHMKVHKKKLHPGAMKKVQIKPPSNNLFKCDICETVFTTNKSLRLHKRMHDPIKSRPMEAPVSYENVGPDTEDTYHCLICDKWIHVGYREIHEEYHDSTGPQFHCEICNRKFMSEDYLVMHMNIHNSKTSVIKPDKGEMPYSCVFCDRKFARPHEKVKHERIHTGEKPHVCEICGKAFRVSYCLTLHMRTHTGERPYECPHCLKRFKAHSVYNHHLLTHSDKRAYKCTYCPKAFKTSVQLAGHKNSHTKPFSCNECNRPFASLYAVRVHTETHRKLNNLKFACKLCGATYARAFALKDHMKSAHTSKEDSSNREEYFTSDHRLETASVSVVPKMEETLEVEEMNSATESEMIIM